MPWIDLSLCPFCAGTGTVVTTSDNPAIAGKLSPCDCGSGVEAITEDGEVIAIGKVEHGKPQETNATQAKDTNPPAG